MATTAQTPQQIVEDRKVAGLLDDLYDDSLDADKTAEKLSKGGTYRALDQSTRSAFDREWDALLAALEARENERDLCLKGKARDTRKLKTLIQAELDALSVLEEGIGRLEVLEDSAAKAKTTAALAVLTVVLSYANGLAVIQKDLADLYKSCQKAVIAARDAKVKAAVTAASAAIGVCLGCVGGAVALVGGITLFTAEQAVSYAFNGTEDSKIKKTWDKASGAAAVADGIKGLPDAFGPALVLVGGVVDISECFNAEREKQDLLAKLAAMDREFKRTCAQMADTIAKLGKLCADAQAELARAVASMKSVRVAKPQAAGVLRYL